jgi:hypothetical protein
LSGMIARAAQEFFGFDFTQNREILVVIAVLLVFVGLFLALAGRRIWKNVMSFIGGIIGFLVGFALGVAISGVLVGFLIGMLGGIIGGAVFVFLARLGISAVGGVLAFLLVSALGGSSVFMIALIVAVVVFIITFAFVEAAIGVVTAVAGGLLFGFGLILLEVDMTLSLIGLLAVIVFGAAFQLYVWHDEEEKRHGRAFAGTSSAGAATMSPPPPPEMPARACRKCASQLRYVPEYNRYYCDNCQEYE